jgi:hypothetical protein
VGHPVKTTAIIIIIIIIIIMMMMMMMMMMMIIIIIIIIIIIYDNDNLLKSRRMRLVEHKHWHDRFKVFVGNLGNETIWRPGHMYGRIILKRIV